MTPEGKKIWNSPQGASLMESMLGEKPVSEQDRATIQTLVETSKGQPPSAERPANLLHEHETKYEADRDKGKRTAYRKGQE